jgi:uncharacterized protein DUF1707
VKAGPGDEKAAAAVGRSHLRASRADRREAADVLKAAFVQGWLAKDEFDARIGQACASRTYAELAAVTADVPAGLDEAPLPRWPLRMTNAVKWSASGLGTPAILAAAVAFASLRGDGRYAAAAFVTALAYFVIWLSVGADMLWEWHCTSLPAARACVRCAHTGASHRAPASCAVRLGSLKLWKRCPCAGYVPPGLSPQTASGLDHMAAAG